MGKYDSGCGIGSDDGDGVGSESTMASGTGVRTIQQRVFDDGDMFEEVVKLGDQLERYLVG
jgi:hypothetical protein